MKNVYVIIMMLVCFTVTTNCQQKAENSSDGHVTAGFIQTMQIDSTAIVPFEGTINFNSQVVAIEYWKPGKLNRSKILILSVKNLQSYPGAQDFNFETFGHKELFSNGRLEYNLQEGSFSFKAWNDQRLFAYTGKLR